MDTLQDFDFQHLRPNVLKLFCPGDLIPRDSVYSVPSSLTTSFSQCFRYLTTATVSPGLYSSYEPNILLHSKYKMYGTLLSSRQSHRKEWILVYGSCSWYIPPAWTNSADPKHFTRWPHLQPYVVMDDMWNTRYVPLLTPSAMNALSFPSSHVGLSSGFQ